MKEKQRIKKEKKTDLKFEVMSHYSGNNPPCCAKCCNTDISQLTIDHAFSDGAEMRRQYPYQKRHLLRWLKKKGYPEGYQVLCKKCNLEKQRELKLYLAGSIDRLSRTKLEEYIKNNTNLKIDGDFVITEDNQRLPIGNLYKTSLKVSEPMKALLASGKWNFNHMSLITKDYQERK